VIIIISKEEIDNANTLKQSILKGNRDRVAKLLEKQVELNKQLKLRKLPYNSFRVNMLKIRNELTEIRKRNVKLVNECMDANDKYRSQSPEKEMKTIEEIVKEYPKLKETYDKNSWRLDQ